MSKRKPDPLHPRIGDVFTRPEIIAAVKEKGPQAGSKYAVAKLAGIQDSQVGKVYKLNPSEPGRTREAETLKLYTALLGYELEVVYRVKRKRKEG